MILWKLRYHNVGSQICLEKKKPFKTTKKLSHENITLIYEEYLMKIYLS